MIQKMNGCFIVTIFFLCFLWVSPPAGAAEFDGSMPLLCAFTKAMQCDPQGGCEQVLPEEVGLSTFVKIDFQKKIVTMPEPGNTRTTEIKSFERVDGKLILMGRELRAWSVVIGEKTGKMTLALAGEDDGFVLFGTCMVP
jgi:hypothetical protein